MITRITPSCFTPAARQIFQGVFECVAAASPGLHVRSWYLAGAQQPLVGPGLDICWNFKLPTGALEAASADAPWPTLIAAGDLLRVTLALRESDDLAALEHAAIALEALRIGGGSHRLAFQRLRRSGLDAAFMLVRLNNRSTPIPHRTSRN